MLRLSLQQIASNALTCPDQLDLVVLDPHIVVRPKDAVDFTVSPDQSFFVYQGSSDIERPTVLVRRLHPARNPDAYAILGQPVEQPFAVSDLLVYQRDSIHLNTPSGL